ncbi:MAG: helix-turn-helix domain-containing protein [Acidimicrobiia bacterium]
MSGIVIRKLRMVWYKNSMAAGPFNPDDYPTILKPSEVAQWLRLSPRMIQLMAKDGRLPAMQIPGVRGYRFLKDDIAAFIGRSMPHSMPQTANQEVEAGIGFGR